MTEVLFPATIWTALLFSAAAARAQQTGEALVPSVTVVGTAEVHGEPDMAEINVGVVTEAESAGEAVKQNNQAMEDLLAALDEHKIAKKDIQTTSFNISPQRRHDPSRRGEPPEIVGYQVTNQVHVKVRRIEKLGEILDAVVARGANQIHGIHFSISDPAKLLDEARRKAMQDARRKAELYAQAAETKLGKVLLIEETSAQPPRPMLRRSVSLMAAGEGAVPVAPGEQTLSAQVTVTYALGGQQ